MGKSVVISETAERQILAIDAWWRANRDKAPGLFEQEVALALLTIAEAPELGRRYEHPGADVRRDLLRSTRNHV